MAPSWKNLCEITIYFSRPSAILKDLCEITISLLLKDKTKTFCTLQTFYNNTSVYVSHTTTLGMMITTACLFFVLHFLGFFFLVRFLYTCIFYFVHSLFFSIILPIESLFSNEQSATTTTNIDLLSECNCSNYHDYITMRSYRQERPFHYRRLSES